MAFIEASDLERIGYSQDVIAGLRDLIVGRRKLVQVFKCAVSIPLLALEKFYDRIVSSTDFPVDAPNRLY
jgi:hypothetical protein